MYYLAPDGTLRADRAAMGLDGDPLGRRQPEAGAGLLAGLGTGPTSARQKRSKTVREVAGRNTHPGVLGQERPPRRPGIVDEPDRHSPPGTGAPDGIRDWVHQRLRA